MAKSPTAELVTERLGRDVTDWLAERRLAGASWHELSIELYVATKVTVTGESLRRWSLEAVA